MLHYLVHWLQMPVNGERTLSQELRGGTLTCEHILAWMFIPSQMFSEVAKRFSELSLFYYYDPQRRADLSLVLGFMFNLINVTCSPHWFLCFVCFNFAGCSSSHIPMRAKGVKEAPHGENAESFLTYSKRKTSPLHEHWNPEVASASNLEIPPMKSLIRTFGFLWAGCRNAPNLSKLCLLMSGSGGDRRGWERSSEIFMCTHWHETTNT